MIKPNELRIGNWFFIPGINKYVLVKGIFITHFRCEDVNGTQYQESLRCNYQPIPLTPEILDKAGFVNDNTFYTKDNVSIIMPCISYENGRLYYKSWFIIEPPKYLHQLQNLIFCLTGEELKIQL